MIPTYLIAAGQMSVYSRPALHRALLCAGRRGATSSFQGIPEDVPTVADIPDGRMPSRLPFGRDVVTPPRWVVLDKHSQTI